MMVSAASLAAGGAVASAGSGAAASLLAAVGRPAVGSAADGMTAATSGIASAVSLTLLSPACGGRTGPPDASIAGGISDGTTTATASPGATDLSVDAVCSVIPGAIAAG